MTISTTHAQLLPRNVSRARLYLVTLTDIEGRTIAVSKQWLTPEVAALKDGYEVATRGAKYFMRVSLTK